MKDGLVRRLSCWFVADCKAEKLVLINSSKTSEMKTKSIPNMLTTSLHVTPVVRHHVHTRATIVSSLTTSIWRYCPCRWKHGVWPSTATKQRLRTLLRHWLGRWCQPDPHRRIPYAIQPQKSSKKHLNQPRHPSLLISITDTFINLILHFHTIPTPPLFLLQHIPIAMNTMNALRHLRHVAELNYKRPLLSALKSIQTSINWQHISIGWYKDIPVRGNRSESVCRL